MTLNQLIERLQALQRQAELIGFKDEDTIVFSEGQIVTKVSLDGEATVHIEAPK